MINIEKGAESPSDCRVPEEGQHLWIIMEAN
jgi:hypothetical protein